MSKLKFAREKVDEYFCKKEIKLLMKEFFATESPREPYTLMSDEQRIAQRKLTAHYKNYLSDFMKQATELYPEEDIDSLFTIIVSLLSKEFSRRGEIIGDNFRESGSDMNFDEIYESLSESYLLEDIDD